MSRVRCALLLAAAAMVTSAIPAIAQPWTLSASRSGITLRWYADTSDEAQAHGVAGAYCGAIGRAVQLAAIERDGSAVIAHYRCR